METPLLRIGTRASPLALAQAHETRARLAAALALPEAAFEIVSMTTTGDRILDRPLNEVGGKGLFTKEIEEALLAGRIDIAVHSSKDMPVLLPEGLAMPFFLPREDPRDAFIGRAAETLSALPEGAAVGSSSLRRQALIRRLRPDLAVTTFRGNVQTRLRKLEAGEVAGTMLACAGLNRLGLHTIATEVMALDGFPPAPGQGAIGIEMRWGDRRVAEMLEAIHHAPTGVALAAERAFLAALDGSCRTPIAAHALVEGAAVSFHGMILTPDGSEAHEVRIEGAAAEAVALGRAAGAQAREKAGAGFFESWG